jgi:Xaa-Pro aminopeptidase
MTIRPAALILLTAALIAPAPRARSLDFPVVTGPKEMFRAHRDKFFAKMPPGSIAILRSAPLRTMSADTEYPYRPDSDFYYLTGVDEPDAIAVFRPGATDGKRYVLFVRAHDARRETLEGPRAGPLGAVTEFGADAGFPVSDFQGSLVRIEGPGMGSMGGYLAGVDRVYLSDGDDTAWGEKFHAGLQAMRARDVGPSTVVDAREILHEMRLVKDSNEIALLRRAADISAKAHARAMAATAPGRYEFEVQQTLDGYCYANGVRRMAYPSIAASGPNSVYLHWEKNDRQMQAGDVLLNDSGAEYAYYATDITRTYPVSGRFSTEQRAIYEAVLAVQKNVIGRIRPGVTHEEIEQASARGQTEALVRLGLLSGDVDKLVADRSYFKFTRHGISHWVGMDVHDAGRYRVGTASRPLAPGMVLTVEPGIYVPANMAGVDPRWWNIGVRIEDTLVVTENGAECLSCAAPKEVADIERTMGKK